MAIFIRRIDALFRRKKPTFAEALAKSGFKPATITRIAVGEQRNRERLLRQR